MILKLIGITLGVVVVETINIFLSANCGNVSISCHYTPLLPKVIFPILIIVWFGYICYMIGKNENKKGD